MHKSRAAFWLLPGLWAAAAGAQAPIPLETVETKLLGSQEIPGTLFGETIDVDGDLMAIGAPDHYVPADARGSVYIFVRGGQGWSEHSQIFPADGVLGDEFGAAVALDGDTLLVGAPSRNGPSGEFEGGAYIFTRAPSGVFTQQVKLLPPGVGSPDRFGERVALWGDLAVVLSSRTSSTGFQVFPFARNGVGQWVQEPVLTPPFYVQDVAIVGTTLILAGTFPNDTTAAAVYVRSGGTWTLETTLPGGSGFLRRLTFDGQTIALAGAAFLGPHHMSIYRRQPQGGWVVQPIVLPPVGELTTLGSALAVTGDRLAVSLLDDGGDEFDSVLLFVLDGQGTWRQEASLVPPGYPIDDGFGSALSAVADTLAIGAIEDNQAGTFAGAVFVAPFSPPGPGGVPPTLRASRAPGGELTLAWSISCASGATDYEVYEGRLRDFASHAPLTCTTGGGTSATFLPSTGDSYYLVVPRSATLEGSYGRRSDGSEIPQGISACLPQGGASCQ